MRTPLLRSLCFCVLACLLALSTASAQTQPRAGSSSLVISYLYTGGGLPGAPYTHNFVEIRNISASPVGLLGKSFQAVSDNNPFNQLYAFPDVTLAPGQSFLLRGVGYAQPNGGAPLPTPDGTLGWNLSLFSGQAAIVNSTTQIICGTQPQDCAANPDIIDFLGYYYVNNYEGTGATIDALFNPPYDKAIRRLADGCVDTDDNQFDFEALTVIDQPPRNTGSPAAQCLAVPSRTTLGMNEGEVAAYAVRLQAAPSSDVMVAMPTVQGLNFLTGSLVFTPQNWATPQTVEVSVSDNNTIDGDYTVAVAHTTTSLDPVFNGLALAPISLRVADDDIVNIVSNTNYEFISEGDTKTHTIALTAQPRSDVAVSLLFDPSRLTVSPTNVDFTTENWNVPQTITVTAFDDFVYGDTLAVEIAYELTSNDPDFDDPSGITSQFYNVSNNDNAEPIPNIYGVEGVEGSSPTFTLRLGAQPSAEVVMTLIWEVEGAATFSPNTLTFDSTTWNQPQTVTVMIADDAVYTGRRSVASFIQTTSTDLYYADRMFSGIAC